MRPQRAPHPPARTRVQGGAKDRRLAGAERAPGAASFSARLAAGTLIVAVADATQASAGHRASTTTPVGCVNLIGPY